MFRKKRFNYICSIMTVFAVWLSLAMLPVNAASPEHITLTWTKDPETTQTITWTTEPTGIAGLIQYGEGDSLSVLTKNTKNVAANMQDMATNLGNVSIHSVVLERLKPGTAYTYRVGDGKSWSEPHVFRTAGDKIQNFKFLVFGDSQSVNYAVWQTTLNNAYKAHPTAAFMINMGDLVDAGQDYAQWKAWFTAAKGVIDTIPVMPVVGNHETYTPNVMGQYSMPQLFSSQFKLPLNGPLGLRGQVYSFDYGTVHFCVLDSQANEEERFVPGMLQLEKAWLEKDLSATEKLWKVILIHKPLYNNKAADANTNIRDTFLPVIDKYHVDVVFTAHDHVYARTYPMVNGKTAIAPAQGTIYVATGRSGSKIYTTTAAKAWNSFFYNPLTEPIFITVEVNKKSMLVKAYKQSGVLLDTWSVEKPPMSK